MEKDFAILRQTIVSGHTPTAEQESAFNQVQATSTLHTGAGSDRSAHSRYDTAWGGYTNHQEGPHTAHFYSTEGQHHGKEIRVKCTIPKPVHPSSTLQNDRGETGKAASQKEFLHGKGGFGQGFLASSNTPRPSEAVGLQTQRQDLPLQRLAVRGGISATYHDQGHAASSSRVAQAWDYLRNLYRRSATNSRQQETGRARQGHSPTSLQDLWSPGQPGKVRTRTKPEERVFGSHLRLSQHDSFSSPSQEEGFQEERETPPKKRLRVSQTHSTVTGPTFLDGGGTLSGKSAYNIHTPTQAAVSQQRGLGHSLAAFSSSQAGNQVVGSPLTTNERTVSLAGQDGHNHGHGRVRYGLGSSIIFEQRTDGRPQPVQQPAAATPHQRQRNASSFVRTQTFHSSPFQQKHQHQDRQHNNNVLHKQDGREVSRAGKHSAAHFHTLPPAQHNTASSLPARQGQHYSRQAEQAAVGRQAGLPTPPQHIQETRQAMGATLHRLNIRFRQELSDPAIRKLDTFLEGVLDRCDAAQLEGRERVGKPPPSP